MIYELLRWCKGTAYCSDPGAACARSDVRSGGRGVLGPWLRRRGVIEVVAGSAGT